MGILNIKFIKLNENQINLFRCIDTQKKDKDYYSKHGQTI